MTNSLRVLLSGIVDYAGLFPPASLDMATTVRNYASYRTGPHSWMLGRLIVPIERLEEFDAAAQPRLPRGADESPWRLSVLVTPESDMPAPGKFRQPNVSIDAIEMKVEKAEEMRLVMENVPKGVDVYFEIPLNDHMEHLISGVKECRARAKVRTGGTTTGAFPAAEALLRFMSTCIRNGVPFKATAGLHHPVRSIQNLTYAKDSPRGTMFGFLNVFLAATLLASGGEEPQARCLLEEQSPEAFRFDEEEIRWRDISLSIQQVVSARQHAAVSFGSCSFAEPVEDLRALKLL